MFNEENDYLYDEDDGLGDLNLDEEEIDEEELEHEEERGVTDLVENDEIIDKEEEDVYPELPKYDSIYGEGKSIYEMPGNYSPEQEELYRNGILQIKKINEKWGCNLNFGQIVDYLDNKYKDYQKKLPKDSSMFNSMSNELWDQAYYNAIKITERKAYADNLSVNNIKNMLISNFADISKVIRIYAKIYPEKLPFNEEVEDVTKNDSIFDSKGKLRKVFSMTSGRGFQSKEFNAKGIAEGLRNKSKESALTYFGKNLDARRTQMNVLGKINSYIGGPNPVFQNQGDRVRRLAQCVRYLRPLQAKRENRSFMEFFTNHKVYVAERDTLRQCKEEMKRLGLSREEISKVLHGGSFNDVKFNDGMTVRAKQLRANEKDDMVIENLIGSEPLIKEEEKVLDKVSVVDIENLNGSRNSIIVEDAKNDEVVEFSPLLNHDEDVEVIEDYFEDKERSNSL